MERAKSSRARSRSSIVSTPSGTLAGEVGRTAMLKASHATGHEAASVIVAKVAQTLGQALFVAVGVVVCVRARLGFDYGKFDYVKHEGRYYLLDANRTPGAPESFVNDASVRASLDRLAGGIEAFL